MRFEVPQFIEIEDKIFGPLTWKQFIYLAGGAGFGVMAWFILPFIFFVFIAIPFGALAGALAFYPVNNRPFSVFLESMFRFFTTSRLYLWQRRTTFTPQKTELGAPTLPPLSGKKYTQPSGGTGIATLSRQLELNALAKKE